MLRFRCLNEQIMDNWIGLTAGGQRVPSIARWTGTVEPGSIAWQMTSSMDFFATALELAHVPLPTDRTIDAISYAGLLRNHGHEASR